jgi:hypothetical protein
MENIKAMFKTHIYVFIKQNFYGPISDKNFSAAISITPSACSRDTVGKLLEILPMMPIPNDQIRFLQLPLFL